MDLTESQKKHLRGRGHDLNPTVMVGNSGLSESVLAEFEQTLSHHELIKVKIRVGDRAARDEIIKTLCEGQNATLIQKVGNVALLYRANPDKPPENRLRIPSR